LKFRSRRVRFYLTTNGLRASRVFAPGEDE
jgi:hypothetical protein